jgi:hypothetical protein
MFSLWLICKSLYNQFNPIFQNRKSCYDGGGAHALVSVESKGGNIALDFCNTSGEITLWNKREGLKAGKWKPGKWKKKKYILFLSYLLTLYIFIRYIILFINKISLEINKEFLTGWYIFRDIWVQSRKFGLKILPIFFSGHHIGVKINFDLN